MTVERKLLPARRLADTFEITFKGQPYLISLGYHGDGTPGEVFVYTKKMSSDASDNARDIAVLLSIASQYEVPLQAFQNAVCRLDDGSPAGLAGAILDHLCGAPQPTKQWAGMERERLAPL